MSILNKNSSVVKRKNPIPSVSNVLFMGQSLWYILTIIIYLSCTLMGFGVAYLISRFVIEMNLK